MADKRMHEAVTQLILPETVDLASVLITASKLRQMKQVAKSVSHRSTLILADLILTRLADQLDGPISDAIEQALRAAESEFILIAALTEDHNTVGYGINERCYNAAERGITALRAFTEKGY